MKIFLKTLLLAIIGLTTPHLHSMDDSGIFESDHHTNSLYGSSYPPSGKKIHANYHKLSDSTPQVSYSLATKKDIDQILVLMSEIEKDEEDSKLLVILPEQLRIESIEKAIQKRRLFIAKSDGVLISMLTLFIIDKTIYYDKTSSEYASELATILISELRCCKGAAGHMLPLESVKKHVKVVIGNKPLPVNPCTQKGPCQECLTQFEPNDENQHFIYYGSAYVSKQFRNMGIATELLEYAFKRVLKDFSDHLQMGNEIILAYGQAEANRNHLFMLRTFATMITSIRATMNLPGSRSYQLRHETFDAFVPAFDELGVRLPDTDERRGLGNLVVYKICDN